MKPSLLLIKLFTTTTLLGLLLVCCSPSSLEDYQRQGQLLSRALIKDLQGIDSREALLLAEPALKRHFDLLADLIIEAREFQRANEDLEYMHEEADIQELSIALKAQLQRIASLEGGLEVLERSQRESMLKVDSYEKKRLKQRSVKLD